MAMNGVKGLENQQWSVGLINSQGKYLTAEAFGFKINASGATMRKKQVWTIEHDTTNDNIIYIKSHQKMYLSSDKRGNVTCNSDSAGKEEKFSIEYEGAKKGGTDSGRWAIKSNEYHTYFGGSEDKLSCNEKSAGALQWWTVHLAVHPQVNLKNVNRKKYALFEPGDDARDKDDEIQIKALIPWGEEAIITLDFTDGKYALKSCNNRFLDREGFLVEKRDENCMYTLQIRSGQYAGMALKDCTGCFLSGVGMDATMKGRNPTVGKDELFTIEDSHPQVFFVAHNTKKVSIKQGVDLSANQDDDLSDRETFQLEFDKKSDGWRLRTSDNKYWSLEAASGIQGVGNDRSANGLFHIEYLEDGIIALKASNKKYITAKMNGSLYATCESVSNKEKFTMTIINRPILILKCEYGFWGFKAQGNTRIECNKHNYEIMFLEHTWGDEGVYYIKAVYKSAVGKKELKYLDVDGEKNVVASSDKPAPFIFQLTGQSRMVIKCPNGNYLKGEQNGQLTAKLTTGEFSKATQWEY